MLLEVGGDSVETMELEAQVYSALTSDSSLIALLASGAKSVFHLQAPSDKSTRYPCLVYSPISDVPAVVGDDIEVAHRITIRLHVITLDGQYNVIYRHINRIMSGLGFMRVQTTQYIDDGQKVLIIDYRIGVSSEWQQ